MNAIIDPVAASSQVPEVPLMIEVEPTDTCNLRCRMCHVTHRPSEAVSALPLESLAKLDGLRGVHVALGSGFEPTVYQHFVPLVEHLGRLGCRFEIITNGVLLHGATAAVLRDVDLHILNLSFDGARKSTYEQIRGRARYEEVLENIRRFKDSMSRRDTFFAVNFTAMRANLREISEAVDLWDELQADQLRVLGMIVREAVQSVVDECLYPVLDEFYRELEAAAQRVVQRRLRLSLFSPHFVHRRNNFQSLGRRLQDSVVSSDHPDSRVVPRPRQALQLTRSPAGALQCASPFTFARILFNGDVQLCYRFSIGNLRDASFAQIWRSPRAAAVRRSVANDESICRSCDYFRFCLKSDHVDYDQLPNHFSEPVLPLVDVQPDGTLRLAVKPIFGPPRLVQSVGACNIVQYQERYLVVPRSLGPLDLTSIDFDNVAGIVAAADYRTARATALAITEEQPAGTVPETKPMNS